MIPRNGHCALCTLKKAYEPALALGDADKAQGFMKKLMQLYIDLPDGLDSNWLGPQVSKLFSDYYGVPDDRFKQDKIDSNAFVLPRLDGIRAKIQNARDPLYAALQFAILGNYLDFSALHGQVSYEKMDELLNTAADYALDQAEYAKFRADLEKGKKLLYLTDNAGEIGFDRLLCEEIEREYPGMEITVCVRGAAANNDALREDAEQMGIPYRIIDNGTNLPSTPLDIISEEAKTAIRESDVIIAKGMGNVESLYDCGYPVYYLFLVKCRRIMEYFNKPMMTPMFIKDTGRTPYYEKG